MKAEDREELRKQIREEVDRDREFIKEVAGSSLKIVGIGVGIVALVIGFLGIKTIGDLKRAAEDKAESVMREHIGRTKQNLYEREIERMKDNAFVDSLIARLAVASIRDGGLGYWQFSEMDYEELFKIMEKPDCSSRTYRHAAGVLARLDRYWNISRDGAVLQKILQKGSVTTYWQDDADYRLESTIKLLASMKYSIAVEDVRSIAVRSELPYARRAAIRYLGNVKDAPAIEKLKAMWNSENDQRTKAALLEAISEIDPESPVVKKWLESLKSVDIESMAKAIELAVAAYRDKHTNFAQVIFRQFVDDGYFIRDDVMFSPSWGSYSKLEISHPRAEYLRQEGVKIDYQVLFNYQGSDIIETMMTEAAKAADLGRLERILKAFGGESIYGPSFLTMTTLRLRPPAELVTASGESVVLFDEFSDVIVKARPGTNGLQIRWCDKFGRLRDEPLKEILNPERVTISHGLRGRPLQQNWGDLLY